VTPHPSYVGRDRGMLHLPWGHHRPRGWRLHAHGRVLGHGPSVPLRPPRGHPPRNQLILLGRSTVCRVRQRWRLHRHCCTESASFQLCVVLPRHRRQALSVHWATTTVRRHICQIIHLTISSSPNPFKKARQRSMQQKINICISICLWKTNVNWKKTVWNTLIITTYLLWYVVNCVCRVLYLNKNIFVKFIIYILLYKRPKYSGKTFDYSLWVSFSHDIARWLNNS